MFKDFVLGFFVESFHILTFHTFHRLDLFDDIYEQQQLHHDHARDEVIMGVHRFRRSDVEAFAKAMAGIRIGEEIHGNDYETPMAMYPMMTTRRSYFRTSSSNWLVVPSRNVRRNAPRARSSRIVALTPYTTMRRRPTPLASSPSRNSARAKKWSCGS